MIRRVKLYIKGFSQRDKVVAKNIVLSGGVKVLGALISVISIPLTLKYLKQEEYGVWLTIYSIMTWLMYLDGGLGSGLRNRFTEAKANDEQHKIKSLISTAYFVLFLTILIVIPIFFVVNNWINWESFLNVSSQGRSSWNNSIFWIFVLFCFHFVFRLIDSILIADQKSGEADFLNMLGSGLSLVIFFLLSKVIQDSFLLVGFVFCGVPVLVNLIFSIYLFRARYKQFSPSLKFVDFKYYKDLMKLGSKFFVIQVCSLITISSTNIVISKVLNPSEVVVYNLAYKYFSIVLIAYSVLTSSLYSSFNEAYQKNDIDWIRVSVKRIQKICLLFLAGIAIMVLSSNFIYKIWVGSSIRIPIIFSLLTGIYFSITIWVSVYATFVSGVGKVTIAYYVSILNSILYLPLAILMGKYFGVEGIMVAQMILICSGLYWLPAQYHKVINKTATGLWNK